ncbi:MAG: methionyl-tRNA formyltransferase [Chitinophagaceae bacterium]|nr:methionyl-tRNA formyltransferase [Chitinophagaceae bacterium]
MLIQILVDNKNSWILPFVDILVEELSKNKINVIKRHTHETVTSGEILIMLSCEKIFRNLQLNKKNLVVHESALPNGKGWSPLTWQILEGKNEIPVTLFEATEDIDAGEIYFQEIINFEGHELINEMRRAQGEVTIKLIMKFISSYPNVSGIKQIGQSTFYKRRRATDSKLDISQSILSQFNLLRVVDNNLYPAFFEYKGHTYKLFIEKINPSK